MALRRIQLPPAPAPQDSSPHGCSSSPLEASSECLRLGAGLGVGVDRLGAVYFRGWEKVEKVALESRGAPRAISSLPLSIPLHKAASNGSSDVHFYLIVYAAIAGANSLCTLLRAVLFAAGALQAAASLHHRLLHRLLMVRAWRIAPACLPLERCLHSTSPVHTPAPHRWGSM